AVPPFVSGAAVDTGAAGRALSDTLAHRGMRLGAGSLAIPGGFVVYHVYGVERDQVPAFEQVRPLLAERLRTRRNDEDERAARQLFERQPKNFASGNVVHFSRLLFEPPNIISVPLTRAEVERYYRDHLDQYAAPEQVRARHILISPAGPGADADAAARAKATEVPRRGRNGADFPA